MILPYVYILTNLETKEFYIGYRYKNVRLGLRSDEDIGKKYFTSSKYIKPIFHKFKIQILAEFFSSDDAYDFEQNLIKESVKNTLCLNRHYQNRSDKRFVLKGPHTEESKRKMRKPHGKINRTAPGHAPWNKGLTKHNDPRLSTMALNRAKVGNKHQIGQKHSEERTKKIQSKLLNRIVPDDQKLKMSLAKKGKTWEEIYGVNGALKKKSQKLVRGKNHFKSRSVYTPDGMFDTVTSARKYFNIAEQTIRNRCLSCDLKWKDWYYA
jgi:group I intron endonuclease